jgi:tRNA(adenine34) deaminase
MFHAHTVNCLAMQSTGENAHFLQLALDEARAAGQTGEVPVGAVVVRHGQVIATGRNAPIGAQDPTAHAEIVALRAAAAALGNYRLDDCELYVTLEPCAMCAGAMLHARLRRVVYGAPDAKTGAAGSVVNLFANTALNHQTEVIDATQLGAACASVASASGQLLQDFFAHKRKELRMQKSTSHPLREDALRTPDAAFAALPGYPWQPHYVSDLPSLAGLRMHYLDEGQSAAPNQTTYLCLHGNPAWSYLYRKMIPIFTASGARVVAPDMVGFGKSDKPKKDSFHSFSWQRQTLLELVERLDLNKTVLVVQDWGGLLGLTLPMAEPQRYKGLVVMNTTLATGELPLTPGFKAWREMCASKPDFDIARLFSRGDKAMSEAECAAYMAPYPDAGHRAATRAFPPMVPEFADSDGAATSRAARDFWQTQWTGASLMAIGQQDPVLGEPVMRGLQLMIRGCPEPMLLPNAGHFVQEHGEVIARRAVGIFS